MLYYEIGHLAMTKDIVEKIVRSVGIRNYTQTEFDELFCRTSFPDPHKVQAQKIEKLLQQKNIYRNSRRIEVVVDPKPEMVECECEVVFD